MNQRLKALQTGNPFKLKISYSVNVEDALQRETFLHYKFSSKRLNGEWFDFKSIDILDVIEYMKADEYKLEWLKENHTLITYVPSILEIENPNFRPKQFTPDPFKRHRYA